MKKIYYLLLLFVFCGYSQTRNQRENIIREYDLDKLNGLINRFNKNDSLRNSDIEKFLLNNSLKVNSIYSSNIPYKIFDIIDGRPVFILTDNANSAKATGTNSLHFGGSLGLDLEGENMLIGVWDGGLARVDHMEFQNDETVSSSRVLTPEYVLPNPPSDSHATHVSGTLIAKGVDASGKGMAPKANLVSYNWTNDLSEVVSEIANNALLISNHSYGIPVLDENGDQNAATWQMGCYDTESRNWDEVAYNSPYYLMVTSAGNSGTSSYSGGLSPNYDKLTAEKNAKNNLVVANANPFISPVNGSLISLVINSSSSQGPSDDGRVKPDIAGDGTNVWSTDNDNLTSYSFKTGTSMASPNVAGSLLLLQEYYNNLNSSFMLSSTLKGLVCHTARDGGVIGPDAKFGWGLLNAESAANLIRESFSLTPKSLIKEIILNQDDVYTFDVDVSIAQRLIATICWIDPPGIAKDNQLNSSIPALVNDLDIRVVKNEEVNFPWKLQLNNLSGAAVKGDNTVDNVEKIEIDNAIGRYTIQVRHKGSLSSGSQKFSLVVSGFDSAVLENSSFNLNNDSYTIYPVPTYDNISIRSNNNFISEYYIIDYIGRVVKEKYVLNSPNNVIDINLDNLNSGTYYVVFKVGEDNFIKRVIKK
ncbi:S8 family serine peptidase [Flavobacterium sp. 316]|uniref:S8 family serine peptidase n=1 Tax=Flavobacterium sp. 316 TaxID=1603293 RepID=UPI0006987782|nr:S8 family serine peptidase [Flavobacterium sp. 316]